MGTSPEVNLWPSAEHALDYLRHANSIPHRVQGEATLLEFILTDAERILDLGSGAGRLLALVMAARSSAEFVALDFSPLMLDELRRRLGKDSRVSCTRRGLEFSRRHDAAFGNIKNVNGRQTSCGHPATVRPHGKARAAIEPRPEIRGPAHPIVPGPNP